MLPQCIRAFEPSSLIWYRMKPKPYLDASIMRKEGSFGLKQARLVPNVFELLLLGGGPDERVFLREKFPHGHCRMGQIWKKSLKASNRLRNLWSSSMSVGAGYSLIAFICAGSSETSYP